MVKSKRQLVCMWFISLTSLVYSQSTVRPESCALLWSVASNPNNRYNQKRPKWRVPSWVSMSLFKWTFSMAMWWFIRKKAISEIYTSFDMSVSYIRLNIFYLRFYFSWDVASADGTGHFLQSYWAELQDYCPFEAMRESEHGYQVALPALTISLIYF